MYRRDAQTFRCSAVDFRRERERHAEGHAPEPLPEHRRERVAERRPPVIAASRTRGEAAGGAAAGVGVSVVGSGGRGVSDQVGGEDEEEENIYLPSR